MRNIQAFSHSLSSVGKRIRTLLRPVEIDRMPHGGDFKSFTARKIKWDMSLIRFIGDIPVPGIIMTESA
jgi:hypothetical protein